MVSVGWLNILFLLLTLVGLLYLYTSRNYGYWKKRNVRYIKPIPFLGNMLPIILLKTTAGEWLEGLYKTIKTEVLGIFIFGQPILVVQSAKLVKSILVKDFHYFEDRTMVIPMEDPLMQNMIFFKKSPGWKDTRAKVTPIFTSGKLKLMFPLILNESKKMVEYMKALVNVPNVEVKEICGKYSVNVIARCAFAVDANSFSDENAEFRALARDMFDYRISTNFRQVCSWYMPSLVRLFKIHFWNRHILDSLKRIFTEVFAMRMASPNLKGNDLIDLLIETNRKHDGKLFTEDGMLSHALQFFGAGFETVSATIGFTLYELAMNPDIQEKLRQQIVECNESKGDLTYEGIQSLKYLDMVVLETLRKYPVLPFIDRMCNADYKVPDLDLVIKKGTPVYIPMFGLHHDPKYFPKPDVYDPERFADKGRINDGDEMYYVPFGEGPRICIGERFGLMGVKLALSSVLLNFKLEKSSKTPKFIEYEPKAFFPQSKIGIPLSFVPIK